MAVKSIHLAVKERKMKSKRSICRTGRKGISMLLLCSMLLAPQTVMAEETENQPGDVTPPTVTPSETPAAPTESPAVTEQPTATPVVTKEPQVTAKPKVKALKKVTGVALVRYSTHAVKVTWHKSKKAKYYRVYYAKTKKGTYHLAGTTKKTHFLVKHLKNKTKYSFYVKAAKEKKTSEGDSEVSAVKKITTKNYRRKIVFAGDSICQGVGYGQAFPRMHSSAKKKTVAYWGLNTVTFHTKRIFKGRTGLQKLIAEKPYRVYMMLGMNEIHYRKASLMIAEYKEMIKRIQSKSPGTDIVLCAVSPVTRAERARHKGMWQIPVFNKKLKKLAKKMGLHYLDYTGFLKDSGGYLKGVYAEGDGYHWKSPAYVKFGTVVGEYDRSLDQ